MEMFQPNTDDAFWENEAIEGNTRSASWWEAAKTFARAHRTALSANQDLWIRVKMAEGALDNARDAIHQLIGESAEIEKERDGLFNRVEELQAQIDAFPYETGAPVGDRLAARIAEYRERTEKAEADRDEYASQLVDEVLLSKRFQYRAEKAEAELEKERRRAEIAESARFRSDERAEKAEAMAEREAARAAKFELQDNGCDELIAALREMLREAVERAEKAEADLEAVRLMSRDLVEELDELREKYRQDADPDLRKSRERAIANLRADVQHERERADRFADMLSQVIDERDAAQQELRVSKADLAELKRYVDSKQDGPVPTAVIDGQGDLWKLHDGSGLYEYGIFNRTLDNIEINWGIEERIY